MNTINPRRALPFAAMVALMFLGVALQAPAQSAQGQLVGTWKLVSTYIEARMAADPIRLVPIRQASFVWMETAAFLCSS
jgi:hypothetical protein